MSTSPAATRAGAGLVMLAAGLWGAPVQAALWTLDSSLLLRSEATENLALQPRSAGVSNRLTLMSSVNAAQQMENSATRLEAGVNLLAAANDAGRTAEGRLALSRSLSDPRNSFTAALQLSQDNNLNDHRNAGEVLLGISRSNTLGATGSWSHQLSERLSTRLQAAHTATGYSGAGSTGASDFRNDSLSAGTDYRWDELLSLGLQLSHSAYSHRSDSASTQSDSLQGSASRALTERSSVSFGLGGYRTRGSVRTMQRVCPLDVALCNAGLVAPLISTVDRGYGQRGTQYSASYEWSADERTGLHATLGRDLSPSGAGMTRADSLSLGINRAFSPNWNGSASFGQSASLQAGIADAPRPRLRTLDLASTWTLTEDFSLVAGCSARHYSEPRAGVRASSSAVYLVLQFQGPKLSATR